MGDLSSAVSQMGNMRLRKLERLAQGHTAGLEPAPKVSDLPTRPCSVEVQETQTVRTHQGCRGGSGQGNGFPLHFWVPSWRAVAKGHAVFPPWAAARAARHGSLLEKASSGQGEGGLSEESTLPPGHEMTRPWGHGVAMEGLITLSFAQLPLAPSRELSRWHGWFSCQPLGAFKRMIAVHWLSEAPPTSPPEQVREARLGEGWGLR